MGSREIFTEAATSAYVRIRRIRPHTSAYVRIRPHTSAYVAYVRIRPHTSAYVAYVAYVRIRGRMVLTREPEREDTSTPRRRRRRTEN